VRFESVQGSGKSLNCTVGGCAELPFNFVCVPSLDVLVADGTYTIVVIFMS